MAVASRKISGRRVATDAPVIMPAPSAYYLALIPTSWGYCGVTWRVSNAYNNSTYQSLPQDGLLSRILTPGLSQAQLRARFPDAVEVLPDRTGIFRAEVTPSWFGELAAFLQDYYADDLRSADAPDRPAGLPIWPLWRPRLDLSQVSEFQLRVLDVVAAIPRGHVLTYGQVAQRLSAPQASRAVGAALGRNPWPVLIPCHRVIASTGKLTGFTAPGGIATKQRMLEKEGYCPQLWRE